MATDKEKVARMLKGIKWKANAPLRAAGKTKYIEQQADKMSRKMTWPEREFEKLMKEIGIPIINQKIVGAKIYDFYEPKLNILFEIDGNYFHGDETIYEELNPMQRRAKKNDEYKNTLAKGFGYRIERVWESDLRDDYNGVKKRMIELFEI